MDIYHMSGAGNTFVVLDARGREDLDFSPLAKSLCAKAKADGFMALGRSRKGDFRLHFYNADGSRGEMCGNGARCICRFAWQLGIAGEEMTVETDAGLVPGWHLEGEAFRVKLNNPSVLDLGRKGEIAYVELGDPGVPHAVKEVDLPLWQQAARLKGEMEQLRYDPAFPKGANVNYFRLLDPETVEVLTFERGVEDFTLACGTGCGSIACALWAAGRLPGKTLTARNRGGDLKIRLDTAGDTITAIWQEGPTQILEIFQDLEV